MTSYMQYGGEFFLSLLELSRIINVCSKNQTAFVQKNVWNVILENPENCRYILMQNINNIIIYTSKNSRKLLICSVRQ